MVALMVVFTILFFLGLDALQLSIKAYKEKHKYDALVGTPGFYIDPKLGPCMCDGGEPVKKEETKE